MTTAEPESLSPPDAAAAAEIAPAKLNLALHVTGRRADGYHLLDSLVAFAGVADRLEAEPAAGLSLAIGGPFAGELPAGGDNLVLRAAALLGGQRRGAALRLEKSLPVAAGIGGGSADAAAALRLLSRLWGVAVPEDLPLRLGADVPVCMAAPGPQRLRGIGERLDPVPPLPPAWVVLANPRSALSTARVFGALASPGNAPLPPLPAGGWRDASDLAGWLAAARNDLEAPAARLCPGVARVLEALSSAPLARMSGSGATCFALLPDRAAAEALAGRIAAAEPGWWVAAAPLLAPDPGVPAPTGPRPQRSSGST